MDKNLKVKGRVFQVVGLDKNKNPQYVVMSTHKDAMKYIEQQDELEQCQIIPIIVHGVKKS